MRSVCIITGVTGALLLSAWEWVLVIYGVILLMFGLVPERRALR